MNRPRYFPAIDFLRLACALGVVLYHLGWSSAGSKLSELLVGPGFLVPGRDLYAHGSVGVPIFFLISGFVISSSAIGTTPLSFLRKRIERLYPAILICAPVSAAIWIAAGRPIEKMGPLLLKSMALWPTGNWVDIPYWTLACEIAFYAYVLAILVGFGQSRLKRAAVGLAFVAAALWLLLTLRAFAVPAIPDLRPHLAPVLLPIYWAMHFALGMLLFFVRDQRLDWLAWLGIGAALAAGLVQTATLLDPGGPAPVAAALWLGGIVVILRATPLESSKERPWARLAGLTTYPLYLLHFALGLLLMGFLAAAGLPRLAAMLLSCATLTLVAAAIARWLEPLIRRWVSHILDRLEDRLPPRIRSADPG